MPPYAHFCYICDVNPNIINGVLGDKAFRGTIADWRKKCEQWVEDLKKDTDNETA